MLLLNTNDNTPDVSNNVIPLISAEYLLLNISLSIRYVTLPVLSSNVFTSSMGDP